MAKVPPELGREPVTVEVVRDLIRPDPRSVGTKDAALRDFHVTLDLPQGEHDDITDDLIDRLLLDGEPVRLIKAEAAHLNLDGPPSPLRASSPWDGSPSTGPRQS
ncbi:hypothetical protein AB0900_19155 [Streptomyces cellulosae]|uniref:hypothetical protein n=1 Tax=unclassified Streptomyces TaxID=2593676 RepID=UPI001BE757BA|nr:hypothetical protein [Streptomyces sp. McG7]MBT2902651.1 hypothetical protein [Streptomyces sp. McG8]